MDDNRLARELEELDEATSDPTAVFKEGLTDRFEMKLDPERIPAELEVPVAFLVLERRTLQQLYLEDMLATAEDVKERGLQTAEFSEAFSTIAASVAEAKQPGDDRLDDSGVSELREVRERIPLVSHTDDDSYGRLRAFQSSVGVDAGWRRPTRIHPALLLLVQSRLRGAATGHVPALGSRYHRWGHLHAREAGGDFERRILPRLLGDGPESVAVRG